MNGLEELEEFKKLKKKQEELKVYKKIISTEKEKKSKIKKIKEYIKEYEFFITNSIIGKYIEQCNIKFKDNIEEKLKNEFDIASNKDICVEAIEVISGYYKSHPINFYKIDSQLKGDGRESTGVIPSDYNVLGIRIGLNNKYTSTCIGFAKKFGLFVKEMSLSTLIFKSILVLLLIGIPLIVFFEIGVFLYKLQGLYIYYFFILFAILCICYRPFKIYIKMNKKGLKRNRQTQLAKFYKIYSATHSIDILEKQEILNFFIKYKRHIKFSVDNDELLILIKPVENAVSFERITKNTNIFEPNLKQNIEDDKVLKFYSQIMQDLFDMLENE